jgi:hypothetical protein
VEVIPPGSLVVGQGALLRKGQIGLTNEEQETGNWELSAECGARAFSLGGTRHQKSTARGRLHAGVMETLEDRA